MFVVSYLNKIKSCEFFFLKLMYNKLKQLLYLVMLSIASLTNNPSSSPTYNYYCVLSFAYK
jgi:hypothetical protein